VPISAKEMGKNQLELRPEEYGGFSSVVVLVFAEKSLTKADQCART
jgi:hypothetical protein